MKFGRIEIFAICGISLFLGCLAVASSTDDSYHLIEKVDLDAGRKIPEGFDYMIADPVARRVYLSHNTEVTVVDADSAALVATIPDMKSNHGIALDPEIGRGFVTDGDNDRVLVFELKNNKVIGEIKPVGGNPDCIIYDPASKRIFTFNGKTNDATAINPRTEKVEGTVALGGRPEYAVADEKGMIYDNIMDKNEVVAIDSRTLTIKARWPIAPAETPTALTMDRAHRRLFIGGRNKVLAIMDADSGKIVQTFPIGDGVDANVYDSKLRLLFSATREGTLHIFHEDSPDKFSVVANVKTDYGAKTMTLDEKTHRLFLDTADFGPPLPPTPEQPHPRPAPIPGTFRVLVYGR